MQRSLRLSLDAELCHVFCAGPRFPSYEARGPRVLLGAGQGSVAGRLFSAGRWKLLGLCWGGGAAGGVSGRSPGGRIPGTFIEGKDLRGTPLCAGSRLRGWATHAHTLVIGTGSLRLFVHRASRPLRVCSSL